MRIFLELLLFALPVIFAAIFHMVVVKFNAFSFLNYPLDHNMQWQQKPIFGKNKTYRGLFVMIVFSIFFTYIYKVLIDNFLVFSTYNLLDFQRYSFLFYGFIYGAGYIIAELPNSFIKRRIGTKEGKSTSIIMVLFDQLDSVIGITLLFIPFSGFTMKHFFIGILFFGLLHIIINYLLFLAGLRKERF